MQNPEHAQIDSVRLYPRDWLGPLDLADAFPTRQPLEVDLGCGKGRFLLARASAHPETNFLGVDRMLKRIRKVDRKAVRRHLDNVRLVRVEAYYAVVYLIPPRSVRTYYIFFPDPWPKKRHHKNRLFNELFLEALDRTLEPEGSVHLATDHPPYFGEMEALLDADPRFLRIPPFVPAEPERTDFELLFVGRKLIHRYSLRRRPPGAPGC